MSPSDYATADVGKYWPEKLAGMVLRAYVPSLPVIIFRPEAQGRPLSEVTASNFSQTTHRARPAQPRGFQGSSEGYGVTLEWQS
ncbi:hypothetical protein RKD23_007467 [Streptomyces sp. SAI-170]